MPESGGGVRLVPVVGEAVKTDRHVWRHTVATVFDELARRFGIPVEASDREGIIIRYI